MRQRLLRATTFCLLAVIVVHQLHGQATATLGTGPNVADDYAATFKAVWTVAPDAARGAEVRDLTLQREAARFELAEGRIQLLEPVRGRVIGAVWEGKGRMSYAPPDRIEAEQVRRFFKQDTLSAPIRGLVLLFTDSTAQELSSRLSFAAAPAMPRASALTREALDYLGDEGGAYLPADLMRDVLNGESRGLFLAHVVRENGDPVMVEVNPSQREGVMLFTSADGKRRDLVSASRSPGAASVSWRGERRGDVQVRRHVMQVALPGTGSGNVAFSATDNLTLVAAEPAGPWVALGLYPEMTIDSARWADGAAATVFKGKNNSLAWVRLPAVLGPRDSVQLHLGYHGDLTERYDDYFFIKGSTSWYARSLDYRQKSLFDVTYRVPKRFALAAVGERTDSTGDGTMSVSRWVTTEPIRNASFNFGILTEHRLAAEGVPPVTILWSPLGHKAITRDYVAAGEATVQEKDVEKRVAEDMTQAMRFYQSVYGPAPVKQFFATEIPAGHGEAFPGLVHLSGSTFVKTDNRGWNEIFRAHELAHQWWGIGVDFATYHDQWLSEGFSTFSGLWYLQTARKQNAEYFDELRRWKEGIVMYGPKAPPLSLGYRVGRGRDGARDYQLLVYQKGAWVLHMLRALLIDLKTMNEEHFTALMREFYTTYRGQYATTQDFQRTVEARVGQPMDWFFSQWVYGSAIPTYKYSHRVEPAADGKYRLKLTVLQEGVPESFKMFVPVSIEFENGTKARLRVLVTGARSEPELPLLPAKPKSIKFNDLEGVLANVEQIGG